MLRRMSDSRYLPALACFNALLALTVGTFAAHGIDDPQAKGWIMTGVAFQLPHVAAVFALIAWRDVGAVRGGAWALGVGSLVFAADLDALALGAPRWVAALAPIGGSLMMAGWAWLTVVALAGPALMKRLER